MTFNKQQKYIRSYLRYFTKDEWLIDELSQVVNIKIYNTPHVVETESQYKGWLRKVTKSVYIDHYRHVTSEKANSLIYGEYDGESDFKSDSLIKEEDRIHLLNCIDKLPEKQKHIVYLRYYCNLNYFNICKIMKCPKNTALSHMHKAKRNLKILLTKNNKQ